MFGQSHGKAGKLLNDFRTPPNALGHPFSDSRRSLAGLDHLLDPLGQCIAGTDSSGSRVSRLDDDPLGLPQPCDLLSLRQRIGVGHLLGEVEKVVLCGD